MAQRSITRHPYFADDVLIVAEPAGDGTVRLSAWERTRGYGGEYLHNVLLAHAGAWYGRVSNRITPARPRARARMGYYIGAALHGLSCQFSIDPNTGCYHVQAIQG